MSSIPWDFAWRLISPGGLTWTFLVGCRILGCLQFAPLTSDPSLTWRMRIMLSLLLTILIAPGLSLSPPPEILLPLMLLQEFAIGACLGLGATLILLGLRGAAELIDQQSGLAAARLLDPRLDEDTTPHAPIWYLLGIGVFLVLPPIGGDLRLLTTLLDSFQTVPFGIAAGSLLVPTLIEALQGSLQLALGVAAPVLIILSVFQWACSLWQRAEPAFTQTAWLFSLRIIVAWVLMLGTMSLLPDSMSKTWDRIPSSFSVDSAEE